MSGILGLDGIGRTTERRIRIELRDVDERAVIAVVEVSPRERDPKIVHGGHVYQAAYERPDGTWVYRAAERA